MSTSKIPFLHGSIVALVTPFTEDNQVDYPTLESLIEWHIASGTHGIVAVGTTGESPTVSFEEHCAIVDFIVKKTAKRVPVIAGSGANATEEAIMLTRHAQDCGADAALVVVPYYNKPSQEGQYQHFKTIHDNSNIPLVLYNVPGRTVADLLPPTVARLAKLPRIIAIKDATADLQRFSLHKLHCPDDFLLLSGEDATGLGAMAMGGHGCISVTANVVPALSAQFYHSCLQGNYIEALKLQQKLILLHQALFMEASPAPVKQALSMLNKCRPDVRLPLIPVNETTITALAHALQQANITID